MKEALNISSNNKRKGIILAGGTGSRLYPITKSISKQLIPIYDKPMVYYPLSTLMLAGIRNILIITTPNDKELFEKLLGDGSELGLKINYKEQEYPKGIAQAFLIAEEFLDNTCCALILGDNIFHGDGFLKELRKVSLDNSTSSIFAYRVNNPEAFGVIDFDQYGNVTSIEEKPQNPKTSYVVTGLYFYDEKVVDYAKTLKPSTRGELEITDLNKSYLKDDLLSVEIMTEGMTWLDTGTFDSLHEAGSYIRTIEKRQGLKIGSPEEVAWRNGWINDQELLKNAEGLLKSGYGKSLLNLLR